MDRSRVLIDTSIIIEHLRKQNRRRSILYRVVGAYDLFTSTVVEFELYAGAADAQKQHDVQEILNWCTLLPFTSDVAVAAGTIYRNLRATNHLIEIRDILIAATALTSGLPLMTLNGGHFRRIDRLQLQSLPA
jgi:predicted nucleic acid-binding protein